MGYNKKCLICGNNYTTKHKIGKYCSNKCRVIKNHNKYVEKGLSRKQKVKNCIGCGVFFKSALLYQSYCSKKCRLNSRKSVFDNFELREYILERDNYTCQKCKLQIGDLSQFHVHHKKPLYKGGKHVEENVTTLCKKCHRGEHRIINF